MAEKEEKETKLVAPGAKTEMVKVKVVRPFVLNKRMTSPGEIVEVPKDLVPRLTEKRPGTYSFVGSRRGEDGKARHDMRYADLVPPQAVA